jgi:hypothetical protein
MLILTEKIPLNPPFPKGKQVVPYFHVSPMCYTEKHQRVSPLMKDCYCVTSFKKGLLPRFLLKGDFH